jgi:acyl-CoA-binding protein
MNLQENMNLQQQFEAAVSRVDNLPGDQAAAHMNELYGLYKQATEGDHDTEKDVVGDDTPSNPSGPQGMSQAQWDSWSQFKGLSEDEARRQYVQKVNELAGPVGEVPTIVTGNGQPAPASPVNAPEQPNSTMAQQPNTGPGVSEGGLHGDVTAGAPYGGQDHLKDEQ